MSILATRQPQCFDAAGNVIDCAGSGQDGELGSGLLPPEPRFRLDEGIVHDRLTGIDWLQDANLATFPMQWQEAIDFVAALNTRRHLGRSDWRLPNRIELRSIVGHTHINPVLDPGHPFANIEDTWYWSSTSAAISPAHAWYVHMGGGRMFYGHKRQFFLAWPVCGQGGGVLRRSGQTLCFDSDGQVVDCAGSGQDAETRTGGVWPVPRFEAVAGHLIRDRLTGLFWHRQAGMIEAGSDWQGALDAVASLRARDGRAWRLPTINELESLVDCGRASPALPDAHPFEISGDVFWSSTTSAYELRWAWALYLAKGAVGVGHKRAAAFHVWPVSD